MGKQLPIEVQNHEKKQGFWYDSMGDVSDGFHTFKELYQHRMALTRALMLRLPSHMCWKSKQHAIGGQPMFDGFFIVGITLPTGVVTYHYKLEHWPIFDNIREVKHAPEWDGHTPDDVIKRLLAFGGSTL